MPETLPDRKAGFVDLKAIRNLELRMAFHRVVTDQPMDLALLDFLRSRARRGKMIRRRQQRTTA